jgi:hypothetical protein
MSVFQTVYILKHCDGYIMGVFKTFGGLRNHLESISDEDEIPDSKLSDVEFRWQLRHYGIEEGPFFP